jgi:hypothetical protein
VRWLGVKPAAITWNAALSSNEAAILRESNVPVQYPYINRASITRGG